MELQTPKIKMTLFLVVISLTVVLGQEKQLKDTEAIKKMCGCFEVQFNFAETFSYSEDSLYSPSKKKETDVVLEYAQLVYDNKNKLVIQHLLQVGHGDQTHIIKHWRQDWSYQNTDFYMYNGDNEWLYEKKDKGAVKGQWTQKVFQVDDSPRYEGSSSWVHVDGKSYWENTTDAPLPRREYTTRNDYNVTVRGNRQEITDFGWIHDQDNHKVIREKGKEDVLLAKEKGYNTYKKVAELRCAKAKEWWKANQDKWATVRNEWDKIYDNNEDLVLKKKVKNKPLYKYLFAEECVTKSDIKTAIEAFIVEK